MYFNDFVSPDLFHISFFLVSDKAYFLDYPSLNRTRTGTQGTNSVQRIVLFLIETIDLFKSKFSVDYKVKISIQNSVQYQVAAIPNRAKSDPVLKLKNNFFRFRKILTVSKIGKTENSTTLTVAESCNFYQKLQQHPMSIQEQIKA